MKRSLLLVGVVALLLCSALTSFAQIPNNGFETWTGSLPTGWAAINITRVSIAHGGSYAARGDVTQPSPIAPVFLQPVLQSGAGAEGFAYSQRPAAFTGFYQFFPAANSGDQFAINVILFKGGLSGVSVAGAAALLPTAVSSYTQFTVPFQYFSSNTPDLCVIQIQIIGPTTNPSPHLGTYFIVDDLGFSGSASAVGESADLRPTAFELQQNYPNPFNPSTSIRFSVAQPGHVSLKVYNVLGVEVASLVNEQKDAGSFGVNWNAAGLPSGMYLYRLSVTSDKGQVFDQSKKLVLLK